MTAPELILHNGRFTTLDKSQPEADAVAVTGGRFSHVGEAREILPLAGAQTRVIDLQGRREAPILLRRRAAAPRAGERS